MITSFVEYIATINFAPFVGILFMLLYLFVNSRLDREIKKMFFALLAVEMLELFVYSWELVTARFAEPTLLRILLSAIGYTARPFMIYLMLLLAMRIPFRSKKALLYSIPLLIDAVLAFSAFFTGIAYSYNSQNEFLRGPLGYFMQVTVSLYFIWILFINFTRVYKRSKTETIIVCAVILLCVVSMVIEAATDTRSFGRTSIIMATIFYFMYFQSQTDEQKIDETRTMNRALEKATQYDAHTGLFNKKTFVRMVDQAILNSPEASGALFFFDLDNFKKYNDTLGHLAGDELLKTVSGRLKALFRSSDLLGRFGGDEFYIFMNNVPLETVREKADLLLGELSLPISGTDLQVTASIGIIYCKDKTDIQSHDWIRMADDALYLAKKQGKNRYALETI